jgi:2-polyprenyl-3-methyl-5-hydroxy-6-metoxy-1,4-benzoquinol methylase
MDAEQWNERYRASGAVWSGEPNAALVQHAPPIPAPGARALDVGCGEGADALWLAGQGWQVTAVDWAGVALERVRSRAAQAGLAMAVVQGDATDPAFLASLSPTGRFDLITLGYLHPEPEDRSRTYAHLPGLLEPGGHLLVVTHDPEHGRLGLPGPPAHRLLGAPDVLAAIGAPELDVLVAASVERLGDDDGAVRAVDAVVLVRRVAGSPDRLIG